MAEITITRSEYRKLIRESERRQAALSYMKTTTYIDKDILTIILGANEEESEG